ncbi:hypothetical protein LWF15_30720 [Kineosporia rhizophila]|uniref:hypothetical protein n=1 Tax=Kineosporia TaxID=49184 RepID=UPI001E4D2D45|nr:MULTISPECIES: hypothetical protein [Kineosporia]MCE0539878.1 hypothetical protein [Kineosporia rhizophila]
MSFTSVAASVHALASGASWLDAMLRARRKSAPTDGQGSAQQDGDAVGGRPSLRWGRPAGTTTRIEQLEAKNAELVE